MKTCRYITLQELIRLSLSSIIIILSASCANHSDVTRTPEAVQLNVLGRVFYTNETLVLMHDQISDTLRLVTQDYNYGHIPGRIGVIYSGTRLRINRVIRITNGGGFVYTWVCTVAKIEEGEFAGKEVAVQGGSLGQAPPFSTAVIGSKFLVEESDLERT